MVYRGAQVAPLAQLSDVQALISKGVNIIRYQVTDVTGQYQDWDCEEYRTFLATHLTHLDTLLEGAPGPLYILDIHSAPGGLVPNTSKLAMFSTKPWARQCLLDIWNDVAFRYKDTANIAFGILNEPGGASGKVQSLMADAVKAIRYHTWQHAICVTPPYSDPQKFDNDLFINGGAPIFYEAHMYWPLRLTHQGIGSRPFPVNYPTEVLDKAKLRENLAKVLAFKRRFKAPILIGEYSIDSIADIPSRVAYLTDLNAIFEKRRYNSIYHAWRESPYWDIEPYPEVAAVMYAHWDKNL